MADMQQSTPGNQVPPTQKIIAMRGQGLSNNQIIQMLQREGYDSNLIFEAMSQADVKAGVEGSPAMMQGGPPSEPSMTFAGQAAPPQAAPQQYAAGPESASVDLERIEEIAEAIIDEKWNEIVRSINKIIDWKDRAESRMAKIEQGFEDLRRGFDNMEKGILTKVSQYDRNITDIGVEIKAMEKVFQKILPTMTENVKTLSDITEDIKGSVKK